MLCPASLANAQLPVLTPYSTPAVFAGNVVVGATVAALGQLGNRRKMAKAALKGATAGAVVFTGKWIVAQNNTSTRLLGRELAAFGSSGVRNAAADHGLTEFMTLAYGPVRFHMKTSGDRYLRVKLDLASSVEIVRALRSSDLSFDTRRSWVSGVPIFEIDPAKKTGDVGGSHEGGVVRFRAQ